jgi:hypothetical protein
MTTPAPAQEPAAFISYSRADSEFALKLAQDLKAAGIEVWLDQLDIRPGHEWDDAIEGALTRANRVIMVLSPTSVASRNVRNEIAVALDEGKDIIPILHLDCVTPLQLRRVQHIDFRSDYAQGFSSLLKHLGAPVHGPARVPVAAAAGAPAQATAAAKAAEAAGAVGAKPPMRTARRGPKQLLRQLWPVIPLAIIVGVLMLQDVQVLAPTGPDDCGVAELDQTSFSAKLYNPVAEWAVHHTSSPQVALVYIDPQTEPAEVLTNTCASRLFLAKLIGDLNLLRANVIVVDKYYSQNACPDQATNATFVAALAASSAPIVVGRSTHALADSSKLAGCMGLSQGMSFPPNVRTGLTRLNADLLRIPLRWPVFDDLDHPNATPAAAPEAAGDTLSLVAAKAQWPDIESSQLMPKLLETGDHPYTTFINLPNIHAMTAVCTAEANPVYADGTPVPCDQKKWRQDPRSIDGKSLNLMGKVVVVGDISDNDMQPFAKELPPFPAGQVPGVYLQANYVESLLEQRFLTKTPLWITLLLLAVFTVGVFGIYWAHDKEGKPLLTPRKALIAGLILLAVMTLLGFGLLLALNYYTPVWALFAAGLILVFRQRLAEGQVSNQATLGKS